MSQQIPDAETIKAFNKTVTDEFRANDGKVGGPFEGAPLLLLHSTGARSGAERVNPMMYQAVDGGWAVFASKAGADPARVYPGTAIHLQSCPGCRADHDGLLEAARRFSDIDPA